MIFNVSILEGWEEKGHLALQCPVTGCHHWCTISANRGLLCHSSSNTEGIWPVLGPVVLWIIGASHLQAEDQAVWTYIVHFIVSKGW